MFSRNQDAAPAAPMAPRTAPAKARGAADVGSLASSILTECRQQFP